MVPKQTPLFNPQKFLPQVGIGKTTLQVRKKQILFSQGDVADAVFYIQAGKVKLSVVSKEGKEAVVAILEPTAFFGEACLTGQVLRLETATALEGATLVRIDKQEMISVLHDETTFSALFIEYLLSRNVHIQGHL